MCSIQIVAPEILVASRGGKQRIIVPGNNRATFYVQATDCPAADRTADFAELKRQLDVADADITLVNKRLDEARGMYVRHVSKL